MNFHKRDTATMVLGLVSIFFYFILVSDYWDVAFLSNV